jgi:DNA mismatch repair protein MutL
VRELFHRVPARRKFLLPKATEFQHVLKTVHAARAVSRFDVRYSRCTHNRRDQFALPAAAGQARAREARIANLVGADFIEASALSTFLSQGAARVEAGSACRQPRAPSRIGSSST